MPNNFLTWHLCRLFMKRGGCEVPGTPLTYLNDEEGGGSDRGSYIIPKKITTSEFVYPKKSLLYLAYPKKSLIPFFATQKNPSVFFFATQKNPGIFHRPKKITFGQHFRPKKITRNPPSLKYVSGAPGCEVYLPYSL